MEPVLRRPYWTPAKWLLIIAAVKSVMVALLAGSMYAVRQRYPQMHIGYQLTSDIFLVLFVLAEAYACYVFRYIFFSRRRALLHTWLTGAAVVVVPLLSSAINIAFRFNIPRDKFFSFIVALNRIQLVLVVALLLVANVYFVVNLRLSWLMRKRLLTDDIDAIGTS